MRGADTCLIPIPAAQIHWMWEPVMCHVTSQKLPFRRTSTQDLTSQVSILSYNYLMKWNRVNSIIKKCIKNDNNTLSDWCIYHVNYANKKGHFLHWPKFKTLFFFSKKKIIIYCNDITCTFMLWGLITFSPHMFFYNCIIKFGKFRDNIIFANSVKKTYLAR